MAMVLCQTVFAQQREHTVERGETLASIAKKYGVTEGQLKAANPNMTMCFTGVRLKIPDPNAPSSSEKDTDDSSAKKKSKSDEKNDTTSHQGGFNKLIKNAGKTLGKTANHCARSIRRSRSNTSHTPADSGRGARTSSRTRSMTFQMCDTTSTPTTCITITSISTPATASCRSEGRRSE